MLEEFRMRGPYLREVDQSSGRRSFRICGIGVIGRDGYYCLLSKEVIDATPDLMLALVVDGEASWTKIVLPPDWRFRDNSAHIGSNKWKVILYDEIPEKEITSVWVFQSLTEVLSPLSMNITEAKTLPLSWDRSSPGWTTWTAKPFSP